MGDRAIEPLCHLDPEAVLRDPEVAALGDRTRRAYLRLWLLAGQERVIDVARARTELRRCGAPDGALAELVDRGLVLPFHDDPDDPVPTIWLVTPAQRAAGRAWAEFLADAREMDR